MGDGNGWRRPFSGRGLVRTHLRVAHIYVVTVGSHAAAATSSDLQTDVLLQPILSQILQMQVAVEFQSGSGLEIKIPTPDWGETPVPLLPQSNRARVEIFPANYAGWKPGCKLWGMEQCWLKKRGRRQDKKCSQLVNCDKE